MINAFWDYNPLSKGKKTLPIISFSSFIIEGLKYEKFRSNIFPGLFFVTLVIVLIFIMINILHIGVENKNI